MSNFNLGLSSVVSFGMAAAAKNTEDVIDSKKTKKAGQAPQQKTQTNTPAKDAKVEAEAKAVYDKFVEATTKFFEFFTEPFKGGNGDHKIKEGECLSEIAEKYGCSLAELQELNNIKDPDKIKEGQVLKIPATSKNANNPEVTKVPAGQYTVKAGDNLTEIAKNFNCSVADLQKANNIDNPDKIKEGQVLVVPEKQVAKKAEKQEDKPVAKAEDKKANDAPKSSKDFELELTKQNKKDLAKVEQIFEKNKDKYEKVEKATGVPAELICAIHYRESGCNFNTYLHNGQKLGKRTTIKPKNVLYNDWSTAAIHALKTQPYRTKVEADSLDSQLEFAERYNGLGYRKRGKESPYVWAGTDQYDGGMFVKDGKYNANKKDQRLGVAPILDRLYA